MERLCDEHRWVTSNILLDFERTVSEGVLSAATRDWINRLREDTRPDNHVQPADQSSQRAFHFRRWQVRKPLRPTPGSWDIRKR